MKKYFWFTLKIVFSVALLAVLMSRLDAAAVFDVIGSANPLLLAVAGLCLLGQTAISAFKWRMLLAGQGQPVAYLQLFTTYLISGFINLFMPSVAGGDAYRAVWLRRHTGTIAAALPSIIVERGSGVFALAVLAVVGLTLMNAPADAVYILPSLAIAAIVAYLLIAYPVADALTSMPRATFYSLAGVVTDVLRASKPTSLFLGVVLLSFVFQLNTVLINWIYATSMNLSVTLLQLLIIVPIVYLVEMIPISLNGVGLREGTFTVLFAQMGLPPEEGLALGLTITIMRYIVGLVGGTLLTMSLLRPASESS